MDGRMTLTVNHSVTNTAAANPNAQVDSAAWNANHVITGTLTAGDYGLGSSAFVTLGTGVGAALAIAVGSAGAPVLLNGAGGTPSSMTATNLTGTASSLTAGDVANAPVIAKVLTGLSASAGTLAATDTILQAFNKLAGLADNAAWTAYTPTITAGTGTITTSSATGRYKQVGKTVRLQITITITTAGTGASNLIATLPVNAVASTWQIGTAADNATGNVGRSLILNSDATKIFCSVHGGGTFIANGAVVVIGMVYEAA
jgi:hypothetical protein